MAKRKAINRAQQAWGEAEVIEGGGERSGPSLVETTFVGSAVVRRLVNSTGMVESNSVAHTNSVLVNELGFVLVHKGTDGVLPPGHQLFYLRDNILVRLKTTGTKYRSRPHMTVSMTIGGLAWSQERAKFNTRGRPTPTALRRGFDPEWPPPALYMIHDSVSKIDVDDWANNCHFDCPPGYDISAAMILTPK